MQLERTFHYYLSHLKILSEYYIESLIVSHKSSKQSIEYQRCNNVLDYPRSWKSCRKPKCLLNLRNFWPMIMALLLFPVEWHDKNLRYVPTHKSGGRGAKVQGRKLEHLREYDQGPHRPTQDDMMNCQMHRLAFQRHHPWLLANFCYLIEHSL